MGLKLKPHGFLKTVASTTAPEQLTTSNLVVPSVQLQAELDNTGYVYVGDSAVSETHFGICLSPGDVCSFNAEELGWGRAQVSLKDIWLDVGTAGNGVSVLYLER